jgi:hypothetical protein
MDLQWSYNKTTQNNCSKHFQNYFLRTITKSVRACVRVRAHVCVCVCRPPCVCARARTHTHTHTHKVHLEDRKQINYGHASYCSHKKTLINPPNFQKPLEWLSISWEDNINTELRWTCCENARCIKLVHDHVQWQDLVSVVLILWFLLPESQYANKWTKSDDCKMQYSKECGHMLAGQSASLDWSAS